MGGWPLGVLETKKGKRSRASLANAKIRWNRLKTKSEKKHIYIPTDRPCWEGRPFALCWNGRGSFSSILGIVSYINIRYLCTEQKNFLFRQRYTVKVACHDSIKGKTAFCGLSLHLPSMRPLGETFCPTYNLLARSW